jgi:glycosyltransferase involved in cell wall biosynthesis
VIVGHGAEADATRALAKSLGKDAFMHFPGETAEVPRFVAAFDVFALSSDSEGLPLSLAEAMSAELPIVSTAVGGVPKVVVEGETGFLAPAGDEEKLREKIRALVDDAALRERFGKRGREIALARYSADRMTDDYIALYRSR